MKTRKTNRNLIIAAAAAGMLLSGAAALADECQQTTSTTLEPKVITIEKPVILKDTEKTFEKRVLIQKAHRYGSAPRHRLVSYRPRPVTHHRSLSSSSSSSNNLVTEKTYERTVEKPIMVEKPVLIDRPVEKVVETPVFVEKMPCVEQQPVILERPVQAIDTAPCPVPPVVAPATIIRRKDSHHLFHLKLF